MNKFNTKRFMSDIDEIIMDRVFSNLSSETFLVTGSTGMIGSQIIYSLLLLNKKEGKDIKVVGLARNKEKVNYMYKDLLEDSHLSFVYGDINDKINYEGCLDFIIHSASITNSKMFLNNPVETAFTTLNGTKNILELAKKLKPKSVIYLSSMEVYGQVTSEEKLTEDYVGRTDQQNIRNCYPLSKIMSENIALSYFSEYNVPVKILRLSQTFGAGLSKSDNRVYAQFLKSSINGEDIVLKTDGTSKTTKSYVSDTVRAIFYASIFGVPGEVYNVGNSNSYISIKEMAFLVKDLSDKKINVIVDKTGSKNLGYAPSTIINLDTSKIEKLGFSNNVSVLEALKRTKEYILEIMD